MYIRSLQRQFAKYRPPVLPTNNLETNQYANNPPPPSQGYPNTESQWQNNQYGTNPPPPAQTYQPSMAGNYGGGLKESRTGSGVNGLPASQGEHEHGYEWEQAREEERLAKGQAPPGYDVMGKSRVISGFGQLANWKSISVGLMESG